MCGQAAWLGLALDAAANAAGGPRISRGDSRASIWTFPTDEEFVVARRARCYDGLASKASVMGFYRNRILPRLIHCAMGQEDLKAYRGRVVAAAAGRVLEIGIGSGLNMPFYGGSVTEVIGLDPSAQLLAMAQAAIRPKLPIEFIEASAEAIPLENASVDAVLTTWTLCSIPDAAEALREMRRVLKTGGVLLFAEHGRAPEAAVRWWQDRLTPIWKRVGGGCHLNRPIGDLIAAAGFRIERLENSYARGLRPLTYMYEGSARPR